MECKNRPEKRNRKIKRNMGWCIGKDTLGQHQGSKNSVDDSYTHKFDRKCTIIT